MYKNYKLFLHSVIFRLSVTNPETKKNSQQDLRCGTDLNNQTFGKERHMYVDIFKYFV